MKKLLALLLVLCMTLASIPVLAENAATENPPAENAAAENDFTGAWHLVLMGVTCGTFELKADGTCVGTYLDSGTEKRLEGTWSADGNTVAVTISDQPLTLAYNGTDLLIGAEEASVPKGGVAAGYPLKFSREPGEITTEELNAYSTNGTVPEGKTKEEMELVQAQMGLLFLAVVEDAVIQKTYGGTWYLLMTGLTCGTFELADDGTCAATTGASDGEQKLTGSWTAEDDMLVLTIAGQSLLLVYDGADLVIYAEESTSELASLLRFSREPGVTVDEMKAYSSAGTVPEGKTKAEMEKVQEQLGLLVIIAALLN